MSGDNFMFSLFVCMLCQEWLWLIDNNNYVLNFKAFLEYNQLQHRNKMRYFVFFCV